VTKKGQLEELLTHELVHAYDHCRVDIDWTNCEHHACSEIRAAALSGDCRLGNELSRGNIGFFGQHRRCVERRAMLSLQANPNCSNKEEAQKVMDKVFDKCYADTSPFSRTPY